ncbi:MAG TPA: DUF4833 domain-containing protein [Syntrophales bacterium]|nr:DUF4833 domain-containing protein [Syntrophales bacterium]
MVASCYFTSEASCERGYHLFFIERSKNKNLLYYDVCVEGNSDLPELNPVNVYWILENGKREELLERIYAYGITTQEMLERNKLSISLAAFKEKKITIEKIDDKYRAVTFIDTRQIVIEKVYIHSVDRIFRNAGGSLCRHLRLHEAG